MQISVSEISHIIPNTMEVNGFLCRAHSNIALKKRDSNVFIGTIFGGFLRFSKILLSEFLLINQNKHDFLWDAHVSFYFKSIKRYL